MECSVCEKRRILIDFFVQQANDIVEYEHGFRAEDGLFQLQMLFPVKQLETDKRLEYTLKYTHEQRG